jgi:uncharacterized repeat protein (TIGR03803 family)
LTSLNFVLWFFLYPELIGMKRVFLYLCAAGAILFASCLLAADHLFQLVTNSKVTYYWPYDTNFTDLGFIGISNTVVSNGLAPGSLSAPNVYGSYSYIDLDSRSIVTQANTYTFLLGSMTWDDAALLNPSLPLVKAAHFTGTEPYPGHGPMNLQLLKTYATALTPVTNALGTSAFYFNMQADFQSTLAAGPADGVNAQIHGFAILLSASQFSTNLPAIPVNTNDPNADPTPSIFAAYVNAVVLPLARKTNALSLVCGTFRLTTPPSLPMGPASFPSLDTQSTFFGMEFAPTNTNSPPFIVSHPTEQQLPAGSNASFAVVATGTALLHYQWQKDFTNLVNGGNITGATSTNLIISNVSADDAAFYSVMVTNSSGAVSSSPVPLAVLVPPVQWAFSTNFDGADPQAGLLQATDGNFYGTTFSGGLYGSGTVFKLSLNGALNSIYSFTGQADGASPAAGLVQDAAGFLYGTTSAGGAFGFGTLFRISTTGQFTNLVTFDSTNGASPKAGLVQGSDGNFYGTTSAGGISGAGTIFRLMPAGLFSTVYNFTNHADGRAPMAALTLAADGNFYGTASLGGSNLDGTVFRFTTNGQFTTLASFDGVAGSVPLAGLVQANDGNFYGTASAAGANSFGTVFKMDANNNLSALYTFGQELDPFGNALDGATPEASLLLANDGNLYGTTAYGGPYTNFIDSSGDIGAGVVFRISTNGTFSNLWLFDGTNGQYPEAPLLQATDGKLYGTTTTGGPFEAGTVFQLDLGLPALPPVFRTVSRAGGTLSLSWSSVPGKTYQLQYLTNLATRSWSNLNNTVTATNATATTSDAIGPAPRRFYRIQMLP